MQVDLFKEPQTRVKAFDSLVVFTWEVHLLWLLRARRDDHCIVRFH